MICWIPAHGPGMILSAENATTQPRGNSASSNPRIAHVEVRSSSLDSHIWKRFQNFGIRKGFPGMKA